MLGSRSLALLTALLILAPAAASAQPSKTLERALKLYEKEDYLSASIELYKVQQGETGDDAASMQRAEFFQGKTLFNLQWAAASLAIFERIAFDPAHAYHAQGLKWLIAVTHVVPAAASGVTNVLLEAHRDASEDELGEVRDEYLLLRGQALISNGEHDEAEASLREVPAGSPLAAAAQLELARVHFRRMELDAGVAAARIAASDPALAVIVTHELAFWTRMLSEPARATIALGELAAGDSPAAPWAILERTRLAVEGAQPPVELRGISVDVFDALAITMVCGQGATADFLGDAQPIGRAATQRIADLGKYEDHAEYFDAVIATLREVTPAATVLRLALGPGILLEPLAWQAELTRELTLFDAADAAWKTTAIAAEVQMELQIREALAHADAGSWLRHRYEQIGMYLEVFDGLTMKLAAGRAPEQDGLVVTAALCTAAGVAMKASSTTAPPITPPPPPRAKGCAGCATGGDPGPVVVVLALFALRRRRR